MVLLESEQFLTELTRLFQKCRLSGSVFITLKKYDGRTKPIPRKGSVEGFEPSDNKCLLRATDGKKKISTVVSSKEVNKFQMVSFCCYVPFSGQASITLNTGSLDYTRFTSVITSLYPNTADTEQKSPGL
ncbi:signal recognition particle 14 kDa protein isoform X2 [Myotis lucifugus]|uniref:signal recognition particle 14 kDa protein isoform X2 n=1 Tax=Myotis lucifugus TaxID=59463 RepID=UPI000CCBDFC6|nr:signal recognition particle 14 kDa protein isoform X2 [Myotis lucifugus]